MSDKITDLKSHRAGKTTASYLGAVSGLIQSEKSFFSKAKFLPFADALISRDFAEDFRPRFFVLVDFRHFKPTDEAMALLRRLKSDRFDIQAQKFGGKYLAEVKRKGPDADGSYGPQASAEVTFEEARGIFSGRETGKLGAYQPSSSGFRTAFRENWDHRGVGFRVVVSGRDDRRDRFEEHIIDDQRDMDEISSMMARINAAMAATRDDTVVPFRPR